MLGCDRAKPTAAAEAGASSATVEASLPAAAQRPQPAAPEDAQRTASGLATKVLAPGTGTDHASTANVVRVSFTGWGTVGGPFYECQQDQWLAFPVNTAIPAWQEALQLMVPGETRRLWTPVALAGSGGQVPRGTAAFPPGDLVFDLRLIGIDPPPPPPRVPSDAARPPPSAKRTPSGIAYRLISGRNDPHAARPDRQGYVTIGYAAWTRKGEFFESTGPAPRKAALTELTPALVEGILRMQVGDKIRLWVPATPSRKGAPQKDGGALRPALVYDVDLLGVSME